jgi:plastocyanin
VLVLALAGVVAYMLMRPAPQPDATDRANPSSDTAPSDSVAKDETSQTDTEDAETTTIVFSNDGFKPDTYTVKVGQQVKVTNNSNQPLQFSSDDHPAHTDEAELNLPVLEPGKSATFTPTQVGTWGFHDHLDAQYTGTLEVVE